MLTTVTWLLMTFVAAILRTVVHGHCRQSLASINICLVQRRKTGQNLITAQAMIHDLQDITNFYSAVTKIKLSVDVRKDTPRQKFQRSLPQSVYQV